jgi:RNA polymerase sigma-70 factor (ECF subfamily)
MNEQERHEQFSELIIRHQGELYGYIFSVVRNWGDADDLFQSVCVILWRKFESFRPASNFFYWARQTAKLELNNFMRRRQSLTCVDETIFDTLTAIGTADPQDDQAEPYLTALRHCRTKLNAADTELLDLRYVQEFGIREIADRLQRHQPNVCRSLNRIRCWLQKCIRAELGRERHSEEV